MQDHVLKTKTLLFNPLTDPVVFRSPQRIHRIIAILKKNKTSSRRSISLIVFLNWRDNKLLCLFHDAITQIIVVTVYAYLHNRIECQ